MLSALVPNRRITVLSASLCEHGWHCYSLSRRQHTTVCWCAWSPISWPPPPYFALFTHLHVSKLGSKRESYIFGLWDQILDMGMVDERALEASLPNQPSSKHKSYMRPLSQLGNGKIVGWKIFSYSLCTRSIPRFPVQNLCFCVGNKLDRLTSSYEGDSWDGGYKTHEPSHQQKSTYFQMKKDDDWLSRNIHETESWSLY